VYIYCIIGCEVTTFLCFFLPHVEKNAGTRGFIGSFGARGEVQGEEDGCKGAGRVRRSEE